MSSAWRLIAAILGLLVGVGAVSAQTEVGVSARVSSERAFIGDPVDLEVVVDGSTNAQPPDLSALDGFTAEYQGDENRSMTSMSIVNGRRTQNQTLQYVFKYALTPTRTGSVQIPPIPVIVDGKSYRTQPVWIEVLPAQPNDDFMLTVQAAKTRLYVGEPVTLRFTWYIGASVSSFRFSGPAGGAAYDLFSPTDRRASRPGVDPRAFLDFTFLGAAAVGERGEGRHNGRSFQTLTFDQTLVPRQSGSLRFGAVNLAFDQVIGQSRDIFNPRRQTSRVVIASDPIDLEVMPLPTANRPADFFGLVGDYSVSAAVRPTSASVGDPLVLSVRLRGPEPMAGLEAPDLAAQAGFSTGFKLSSEGWTPSNPNPPGERAFTTTIRARDASVTSIPSIQIPYFDPERGEYRRANSAPIPISIKATTEVTAADAVVASSPPLAGPRLTPLERLPLGNGPAGIVEGGRGPGLLAVDQPDAIGWVTSPAGIAILGGPVVVFLGATIWGPAGRAWRHPRRRSLARAERSIQRAPGSESPADAIARAIRTFVGERFGRHAEALTARDCASLIAEHAPDSATEIGSLLDACEATRYGRRETNVGDLARGASLALRRLDADLRSRT